MRVAIYLATASVLYLNCLGQVVQKSSLKTTASVRLSAETSGIEVNGAKDGLHVFSSERPPRDILSSPTDIIKGHRLLPADTQELVFIVKQRNMAELTRLLHDLSDPTTSNYGNHLTREGVVDLTSIPHSCDEIVTYLHNVIATVLQVEVSVGLITARGSIGIWERMLNTEFHSFSFRRSTDGHGMETNIHDDRTFTRTEKYFVPGCLDGHIGFIQNTIDAPAASYPA